MIHCWAKGRHLSYYRATRNPRTLPGSCSLPAMSMPSATKRISKTLGLQHMTKATRQGKTRSSYSKPSPPPASNATSYPLILGRWSGLLQQRKNRGYQAGTRSAAHLPSPPRVPHAHPCSALLPSTFKAKTHQKPMSLCVLGTQSLESLPGHLLCLSVEMTASLPHRPRPTHVSGALKPLLLPPMLECRTRGFYTVPPLP